MRVYIPVPISISVQSKKSPRTPPASSASAPAQATRILLPLLLLLLLPLRLLPLLLLLLLLLLLRGLCRITTVPANRPPFVRSMESKGSPRPQTSFISVRSCADWVHRLCFHRPDAVVDSYISASSCVGNAYLHPHPHPHPHPDPHSNGCRYSFISVRPCAGDACIHTRTHIHIGTIEKIALSTNQPHGRPLLRRLLCASMVFPSSRCRRG